MPNLKFKVIDIMHNPPDDDPGVLYLMRDNWNDYSYKTLFEAYYAGELVGGVKIAFRGMTEQTPTFCRIPPEFESLSDDYYSLWPGIKACQRAYAVCEKSESNIFAALNDISYDLLRFDKVISEDACKTSLMREASVFTIRGQLHRITHGKAALTKYSFNFALGPNGRGGEERIDFDVTPEELPSSNAHVLIGRNGVGKTHLLKDLALAACGVKQDTSNRTLGFKTESGDWDDNWKCSDFASVLVVSFSPFDSYSDIAAFSRAKNDDLFETVDKGTACHYVGLGDITGNLDASIKQAFNSGARGCCAGRARFRRWVDSLETLQSDPMFSDSLGDIWAKKEDLDDFREGLEGLFDDLSSGHKAVLSIITGCVAMMEERSLLLLDEPENHLHPPLLAAFIRSLSELLIDRNSVAVIATHSPVVLQEVPASCVWMLDRSGDVWSARRPGCETFGTNFETLTTQVFGIEVEKSGYHKVLRDAVLKSDTFEEARDVFTGELGSEALGILRTLWVAKEKRRLS